MKQCKPQILIALLAIITAPAGAQSDDPPSRVARVSYLQGSVAFRPGTVEEWSNATLNYPLTTGDHLWTDPGSRAEIHTGLAAIRMASETALAILNLDDGTIHLSLTQGSLQIHVRSLEPEETIEIATPSVAVTLLRPGDYRIDADGDGANHLTTVTVRGGDASVAGGGAAFPVHARETARIRGMDTVNEEVVAAIATDEFESWAQARDEREEKSVSAQYVPREMTGYEDLDDHGSWREEQDYGWVWAPRTVAADWAPYRFGRWAWIEPWGWTWIDDAPWGFAPFHYGRWAYTGGGWIWVPGRRTPGIRPVYAPALVVFAGGPRFGSKAVWFPLGPREVYRPSYRVSERYVRNVNVVHVTNINVTNVRYVNQRVGAMSTADHDRFVRARHIGPEGGRIDPRDLQQAQVIGTTARVAPRRESVIFGSARNAPPARVAERKVVVRAAPPPQPVPFGARERVLEANQGRPLDSSQLQELRRNSPARQPMVRTADPARQPVPAQPAPRAPQPRAEQPPRTQEPPRVELPRKTGQPRRVEQPPKVEQPRQVEQPPKVEPRRVERPPKVEQPRQVEQPPKVERPRRVERQPKVEQPRQVEQPPKVDQPQSEPRRVEPRRPERPAPGEGGRGAKQQREERKAERKAEPKKDQ